MYCTKENSHNIDSWIISLNLPSGFWHSCGFCQTYKTWVQGINWPCFRKDSTWIRHVGAIKSTGLWSTFITLVLDTTRTHPQRNVRWETTDLWWLPFSVMDAQCDVRQACVEWIPRVSQQSTAILTVSGYNVVADQCILLSFLFCINVM